MDKKTTALIEHWREAGPIAWAEGAYGWIDIDGKRIKLAPWQQAAISAWWEHREIVTTFAVSNVKKTGKTFLNALLLAWRWLALPGEHFAVGNDLDQSAGRQFQQISEMVRRNDYLKRYVKATAKQLIFEPTGSTITALAVDAAGNAGANHLTASHTEAWGIVYEGGIRAYEELTPPPGRFYGLPTLRIADSYAGFEGESDTWHNLVDRGIKGQRLPGEWPLYLNGGELLFHMDGEEGQQHCFRGTQGEAAIYYADQKMSLRPGTFQRLHENKRATGSEVFIEMDAWDACVLESHRPILPSNEFTLYLGVDASIKHDSAAVVAVTYDAEISKVILIRHRIWQPTATDPLDIDGTIGAFIRELNAGYSLGSVKYDPYQLHDLSGRLRSDGITMEEYPQSVPNLTAMGTNLYELIKAGNLILYPDAAMRAAASHAIALQTSRGWRIAKERSSFRIDVIVSLAMAAWAAVEQGSNQTWLIS